MKISTRQITLAATLCALCAVSGMVPYVFFLPVLIAAATLSAGMTAFIGMAFGAISLGYCFISPVSFVSLAFIQAPYIALFPRMAAALGAFGVRVLLQKLIHPTGKKGRYAILSLSAAAGSLFNTALVVGMFALVMPDSSFAGISLFAAVPEMLISGAIECALMTVLVPPIALTLQKTALRTLDARKPKKDRVRTEKQIGR